MMGIGLNIVTGGYSDCLEERFLLHESGNRTLGDGLQGIGHITLPYLVVNNQKQLAGQALGCDNPRLPVLECTG